MEKQLPADVDFQLLDLLPIICREITPERIYGKNELLLIILPNDIKKSHCDLKSILAGIIGKFQYAFCHIAELTKFLNEGNLFFSIFCIEENLLYCSNRSKPPLPLSEKMNTVANNATDTFYSGHSKAKGFLAGAAFFIGIQNFPLAAFMLHQAMESSIRTAILVLEQQEVKSHTLSELNQHLKRFGLLQTSFITARNERDRFLLERLETAYVSARYTSCYRISYHDLLDLQAQVSTFILDLKQAFENMIVQFISSGSLKKMHHHDKENGWNKE